MEIVMIKTKRSECGRRLQAGGLVGLFIECRECLRWCHRDSEDQARRIMSPHGPQRTRIVEPVAIRSATTIAVRPAISTGERPAQ
jgi:hypothetical protein